MRNFLFLALLVFSNAILGQESSLLLSVNYPSNAFDVSPEMAKMIRAKVDSLQAEGDAITAVEIVSHTDSVGSFDYNQQLSSQRAEAMTHFLSTQCQIPKEAIVPRFYGFTQPIGEGEVNRRTEIHLHFIHNEEEDEMHKLYAMLRKKPEEFLINNLRDTVLLTQNGVQYIFEEKSFKGAKNVRIVIDECFEISDMLAHQLTTTSDGELLETAGMFRVQAFDEKGNKLEFRRDKFYTSIIPTAATTLPFQMFDGAFGEDSIINWTADRSWLQNAGGPAVAWCTYQGGGGTTSCPLFFCKIRKMLGMSSQQEPPSFISSFSKNTFTDDSPCGFLERLALKLNIDNFELLTENLDSILLAHYGVASIEEYFDYLRAERRKEQIEREALQLEQLEQRMASSGKVNDYDMNFFIQQHSGLEWRNIDYFFREPRPIALRVKVANTFSTRCFIVFKENQVIIPLPSAGNDSFSLKAAPKNKSAHLIVMGYRNDQAYFAIQEINTSQKNFEIAPEPVSIEVVKNELQQLDRLRERVASR